MYNILKSIFISIIIFIISIYFIPIRFEENDDIVMLLLASGRYTGDLESNLIFIHPLYGAFLNLLYSISNRFEWYTILFIIFHFFSYIIVIYEILKIRLNKFFKIIIVLFYTILTLNLIINLQFTTVSFTLLIAGFIVLDNQKIYKIIISFILIFIASLIRYEASMLFFLILMPFILFTSLQKKYKSNILYLLIFLIINLIVHYSNEFFKDNEWKNYDEFNRIRTKINDNSLANYDVKIYEDVCSDEQFYLFKEFYIDHQVFDTNKLKIIFSKVNKKNNFSDYLENTIKQIKNFKYELILASIILLILLYYTKDYTRAFGILIYLISLFCLFIFITIDSNVKLRVFYGFILSFLYIYIIYIKSLKFNRVNYILLSFFTVLFSYFYSRRFYEKYHQSTVNKKVYSTQLKKIEEHNNIFPNQYILPFSNELLLEYSNPFRVSQTFKSTNLIFNGWLVKSPHNNKLHFRIGKEKKNIFLFINCYHKNKLIIEYFSNQYKNNGKILYMTKHC